MRRRIHGTLDDPARQHPVLDLAFFESVAPIGEDRRGVSWINDPTDIARVEQARRMASAHGSLGKSSACDMFVWSSTIADDKPWLTRLGGRPWRPADRPWPMGRDGLPLTFLGQLCFVDSQDITQRKLPGDVLLIFGSFRDGWVSVEEDSAIEWSPVGLKSPCGFDDVPRMGQLPFTLQGVIHRTVQYTQRTGNEAPYLAAGFPDGGFGFASLQATMIGVYVRTPQDSPWEDAENSPYVASLSSYYFQGAWPLCDISHAPVVARADGETKFPYSCGIKFGIGDAGCIAVQRDEGDEYSLEAECH